jgi:hypothetical protein
MGAALLLGAAVALPAGFVLGRLDSGADRQRPARQGAPALRDVFSPSIRDDPYFFARQREGVDALERHCARTSQGCAEARAARKRLSELDAAN